MIFQRNMRPFLGQFGNYFVELNPSIPVFLYQDICLVNGGVVFVTPSEEHLNKIFEHLDENDPRAVWALDGFPTFGDDSQIVGKTPNAV